MDKINHPDYYNKNGIEVFDIIDAYHLDFYLGNVVKYICRAGKKDASTKRQDLRKAIVYLKSAAEGLRLHNSLRNDKDPIEDRLSLDSIADAFGLGYYRKEALRSVLNINALPTLALRKSEAYIAVMYLKMNIDTDSLFSALEAKEKQGE